MLDRLKQWLKRTPMYPVLRAARDAVRPKTRIDRAERRDARLTAAILPRLVRPGDHCVDVGAHAGDVLAEFLRLSPGGVHVAVEPIPHLAAALRSKFPAAAVHHAALSDTPGTATFHVVRSAPALNGIRPRPDIPTDATIEQIEVPVARLDDLVPADRAIRLIKIDVEGAELGVLRGAAGVLARCRPWVLFEHGSAAAVYGTTPGNVFDELARHGLGVWHLGDWLGGRPPLSKNAFAAAIAAGDHWNFLAGPADAAK